MTNFTYYLDRPCWIAAIVGAFIAGIPMSGGSAFWSILFGLVWWNFLRIITKLRRDLAESRRPVVA